MPHRLARLLAVAAVGGGTLLSAGPAAHAAYTDPFTAIDASPFSLTRHDVAASSLGALDTALPNVSLTTILDDANHPMRACTATQAQSLPVNPAASTAWCFDTGDESTTNWSPQGLTTSGDFDGGDGAWGTRQVAASGWHDDTNDARVAWIDFGDPSAPRYRWVYLVEPTSGGASFRSVSSHLGGMVWSGDALLVTDENHASARGARAIDVFDFAHLLKVSPTLVSGQPSVGKGSDGVWRADGYSYVMVLSHYYTYNQAGDCTTGQAPARAMCFSSMSLDKTTSPPSIVTSEYLQDTGATGDSAGGQRDVRYSLGTDKLPATDSAGVAHPAAAYLSKVANQQGVLAHGGTWWISHSSSTNHGQLWAQVPNAAGRSSTCTDSGGATTRYCWSVNPEALTYWYHFDTVWSQNETPGSRALFAVPFAALP